MPNFQKVTDVVVHSVASELIPVSMRMPYQFGSESIDSVTVLSAEVTVQNQQGDKASGFGQTPLSATWAWPDATLTVQFRLETMLEFREKAERAWANIDLAGHAFEIGASFLREQLPRLIEEFNEGRQKPLPLLAALVVVSAFDIATHDAYGNLNRVDIYETYQSKYLNFDLSEWLEPDGEQISFYGKFPSDYFVTEVPSTIPAWHAIGGVDRLEDDDLKGNEPNDGYPVTLRQWIEADGLNCLKIKLRGNDSAWDLNRLIRVGQIAEEMKVEHLSADFNCTVLQVDYVNQILDQLKELHPKTFDSILYVEQPFPADIFTHQIDVISVAQRKPIFLDESAHDWRHVRLGRQLGWTGVALKTCKTQTGALLSLCWARAHGMPLMVQDLTNPMLAQIPHIRLAAHAGTIMGVESNAMQFYPDASLGEAAIHPGLYKRDSGILDLRTLGPFGFGYRKDEIAN